MSPPNVRRYRAERLLRSEFEGLRSRVLTIVAGKLRSGGVSLDRGDLEACYSQAWQGLYAALLEGEEVANPTGWLVLVTFRRAIDESRSRGGDRDRLSIDADAGSEPLEEHDFAAELDDRARLRQLLEGMKGRLSERECQAAALCYLQGLSRSQAASQMGISKARMRKLMEGKGAGRPGVAGKVGELLETIQTGGFCEQQSSLMRGLAFGILDPEGKRHMLAVAHRNECPACRRYVASLRELAAVLPPVALPWRFEPPSGARVSRASRLRDRSLCPRGAGRSTVAGTHGGSLLAGGSAVGKFAVGALVVVSAGAGSLALVVHDERHEPHRGAGESHVAEPSLGLSGVVSEGGVGAFTGRFAGARAHAGDASFRAHHRGPSEANASREFSPERGSARRVASSAHSQPVANAKPSPGASAQREFGIE
jgi:DNA-directed RNA polymerase specialized sigma24 family protein